MMHNGVLHATPKPFIDESFASWLQRICTRHACSMHWLTQFLGLPVRGDPDLGIRIEHMPRLAETTGMATDWHFLVAHLDLLKAHPEHGIIHKILKSRTYRWCPTCFFLDRDPYFRRSWRFGPPKCLVHGTRLLSRCGWCGAGANLGRTSYLGGSLNMGHCHHCGQWLGMAPVSDLRQSESRAPWRLLVDIDIRDIRREFAERIQVVRSNDHSRFSALASLPGELPWSISRSYRVRQPALRLDSWHFAKPDRLRSVRRKWSSQIPRGTSARTMLAAALLMIRAEVRTSRDEGQS